MRYTALSVSSVCGWEGHNLAASWTCKWDCSTCAHHPALDSPELQGTQAGHQHLGRRNPLVLCWSLQHPSAALMFMEMQMICKHNNHFLLKAPHMTILQEIPLLRGAESDLIPPFPKALLHAWNQKIDYTRVGKCCLVFLHKSIAIARKVSVSVCPKWHQSDYIFRALVAYMQNWNLVWH